MNSTAFSAQIRSGNSPAAAVSHAIPGKQREHPQALPAHRDPDLGAGIDRVRL